jgi:predicted DNA-binding protein YlxM (UPF0122 family)
MTKAAIIEHYGLRLSMVQLADVLGIAPQTLYNQLSSGELHIPTYVERGRRFASYDAVADYLDNMAEQARKAKNPG